MKALFLLAAIAIASPSFAQTVDGQNVNYLVKFKSTRALESALKSSIMSQPNTDQKVEIVTDQMVLVSGKDAAAAPLMKNKNIEYIQPDYELSLIESYKADSQEQRNQVMEYLMANPQALAKAKGDNPAIPMAPVSSASADPLFSKQWGMIDMGAAQVWPRAKNNQNVIVAVIDSGVDYTHPDLIANMWRNPGETGKDAQGRDRSKNGIDDDGNGYVDDVVGYDFVSNDSLPYDKSTPAWQLLLGGGNPGHGTHCAGNVAARGNNGMGISGVAPNAQIMALRFISEKGSGVTSAAIKAIRYAVDNGARVLNNSWGSSGEDPKEQAENRALREAIQYAESKGVLFIVAAGNGFNGKGYDNDTSARPAYPASYPYSNIISVAAIDVNNKLGRFSNYGVKTVHIGAPGVKIFSTVVGGKYSDQPIPFLAVWEGTSMAAPHVAGAAALYWAQNPNKTMAEVKDAILKSAAPIPALAGKVSSGGKLNLVNLMKY